MTTESGDYVLGTQDAEVARLGLQHRVWRDSMLSAWRSAGLRPGWRVIDVGAGPGYATTDLAEAVGPSGRVLAVERSTRFVQLIEATARERRLTQVQAMAADLMVAPAPPGNDMVWCRWVASFVPSVTALVDWIHDALRSGGVAVFHEYVDYASWQFAPARPHLREFVLEVMASWRAAGGEPDVAASLIAALNQSGFRLTSVRPLVFAARPGELMWQWPARFVATNVERLCALGRVSDAWTQNVIRELQLAEQDPESVVVTPMVLELIALRDPTG